MSQSPPDPPGPPTTRPQPPPPASGGLSPDTVACLPPLVEAPAGKRPPVSAILDVLRRLRVLEREQMVEAEHLAAGNDTESLCRELVKRQWLTALQANRLLQGQGETLSVGGCVLL